jgi:hypothetical protein
MPPAEMLFRLMWARLLGRPMFPARPLRWGGVIHPTPAERLIKVYRPNGEFELGWTIPGDTDEQIIEWVTRSSFLHASLFGEP